MQKSVVLFAAVLMSMLGARVVTAESVLYATYGTFANPAAGFTITNTAVEGGTSSIHDGGVKGSTITFTGVTNEVDTPSVSPLGIFMTTTPLTKGEIDNYNGTTFTIVVDQVSPTTGSGSIVGTLTGSLTKSTKGAGGSSLHLAWGGAALTIGRVTYAPEDQDIAGATFTVPTTLQSNITAKAVPAPASAAGGAGLLGLIGGLTLRRRMA